MRKKVLFLGIFILSLSAILVQLPTTNTTTENLTLKASNSSTLVIGVRMGPQYIDPHDAWDSSSYYVIEQVCEGLFTYNYSTSSNDIIPNLALDFGVWSLDGLNYTVQIRQNVTFHDGSPFNASAVKWNFDRLDYLMNASGTLPSPTQEAYASGVYRGPDGTPIINTTEVKDLYTIKFVLNKPFGAFEGLLCFSGSYIMSPSSTAFTEHIDLLTGKLIGTGPFIYDSYLLNTEVQLHAFENYWRSESTIENLVYSIINDRHALHISLLAGDLDILLSTHPDYLELYNESTTVNLVDSSDRSWGISYLGMNNNQINQTFREAISYSIDYDYIINEFMHGAATRLKSPIPKGIRFSNYSLNIPTLNITHARNVMKSMGYGVGFTSEFEWLTATFATFNFTFMNSTDRFQNYLALLQANLARIGISVEDGGVESWAEYLDMLFNQHGYHQDMLQIYLLGWGADYNDPSQFINVLFSNRTDIDYNPNTAQYNGGYGGFTPYNKENDVQLLMEQALNSTNQNERKLLYDKIQKLIIERDFPWLFTYTPKMYVAYNNQLEGFEEHTLITLDKDEASSIKGNLHLLSWRTTTPDELAIPGYSPFLLYAVFLVFIYPIYLKVRKKQVSK